MATMEIDLNILPIPDWGLECPRCRYPLVGLPGHRCPECGTTFDMADVVKSWHRLREPRFTGHELPLPDFGLLCYECRQPLAGARRHACPACGVPFDPEAIRPRRDWFVVDQGMCGDVSLAGLEPLLAAERVPHMRAHGKLLAEIYGVAKIVGSRLLVPAEFYFELLWLIREAEKEIEQVRREPMAPWTCPNCGEEVPGHFKVCWSCEQPRKA
jgi:predicted amidophosphoribosyltransferase